MYWGLEDDSTHRHELVLMRADAADASALNHHLADLIAAAPAKRRMNPNHCVQNELYAFADLNMPDDASLPAVTSTCTRDLARESPRESKVDLLDA
jgi:hypothetical protein